MLEFKSEECIAAAVIEFDNVAVYVDKVRNRANDAGLPAIRLGKGPDDLHLVSFVEYLVSESVRHYKTVIHI